MYKIVGVNYYSGEYEGRSYKGYKLHCVRPMESSYGFGQSCFVEKIGVDVMDSILTELCENSGKQLVDTKDLIGIEFHDFYYNRFSKVTGIRW